ncbi:TrmH family RNA methyltransferase [Pullulanibacillus pueri]|uniref:Putative tRNA/rRNA methyltransferase YsgA n=1 Tax=Pullulanibacillus pueri TaxID=1437324 RepID=A0A8J2ZZT2_9BACL|nr:RNA methyltransferase [Pullulanibacillus pueri]MBM7682020.1 TrmH family RNA methyltransferase [Pullulanibacillus pueri]GGH88243.1 putative tRNA/rRNA methyltransferase YsgA [Pullulanibacillus pueri]
MNVQYIQSTQNKKFKEWRKLLKRRGREKAGFYLIEGPHLVEEALKDPDVVQELLLNGDQDVVFELYDDIAVYQLETDLFKELSTTENPQGMIAVCKMKSIEAPKEVKRVLLLDAVQDPGNLGTLIRTADAAGLDAVYLGDGCVDQYNEKTLRSAQGSHFHLPVIRLNLFEAIVQLKAQAIPIYGTSLTGTELSSDLRQSRFGLLVGNEANGVHPDLLDQTDFSIKIPIYGQAESLNVAVAAGILMYYLRGL